MTQEDEHDEILFNQGERLMNRREFMAFTIASGAQFSLSGCLSYAPQKQRRRPNILIIVTDDQGYADLSAYSHSARDIATPNMDRIAKDGVLFKQAYASSPVCSPSRAGWNTGCYQQRWDQQASWLPGLPKDVKTIAEYLKEAGYATGKIGKNDFGTNFHKTDVREYPLNHGYDEFLGFSSHAHDFFLLSEDIEKRTPDPYGHSAALGTLFHNRSKKSFEKGYTTEIFTDAAIDFMQRQKDNTFFLTVSYNSVHHLIHEVPDRYLKKFGVKRIDNYKPETMGTYSKYYDTYNQLGAISDEDMRKYYLANLNCMDDNIGRLLEAMNKLGIADNTLVIFFADNGGSPLTGANNRPLRGSKYRLYEGGIRIPFMVRWPGHMPKGKLYKHPVSALDVLPACLEAAGIAPPSEKAIDGKSFLGAVKAGKPCETSQKPMFWRFEGDWAVRHGDWKLVKTADFTWRKPTSQILQGPREPDRPMLFNLKNDPAEQHDVFDQHRQVVQRLSLLFEQWQNQMRTGK